MLGKLNKFYLAVLGIVFILSVFGCGSSVKKQASPPVQEVGVVTIKAAPLSITTELPGRLQAVRSAEVRARASGILLKRVFEEGADVKEGEVLFQIDPAPLQANYDSAQAALNRAQALLEQSQAKAKRYKPLAELHAVSDQEFVDVTSLVQQNQAEVQQAKANLETARLNLSYATVTAPITGRIGTALVTEGALVSAQAGTELAVIQQLDPIYFDFTQSSTEVLRLKKEFESGKLTSVASGQAKVTLLLEDGTGYSHPGKLLFAGISVDTATGMITLRAEFPNPDHLLLPGMFARGILEQAVNTAAIQAPQRGVILGPHGTATALVVTADNKVESRPIKVSSAMGDQWVIASGLQADERIIVEGLQKVRPGMTVKPVPFVVADSKSSPKPGEDHKSQ